MAQSKYPYYEFSGALQQKSTNEIRKPNEVRRVKNVDFGKVLGAMRRRDGAQSTEASLPKMPEDSPPLGAFIARFSSGAEIWAAQDIVSESPPTNAELSYWAGPGVDDWTLIDDTIPFGSEVNMTDDLDEVWVSHYDPATDDIGEPFTVDSAHDVSLDRHLFDAPWPRFFIEFRGAMWAANVLVGADRFRDRLYKSSGPTGAFAFVRSAQTLSQTAAAPTAYENPLEVDSVRYVKAGMSVGIYEGGTDTLLYTLTVLSVDKVLDTVSFSTPDTLTFANTAITTATNIITITDVAWLVTGTPVTFWQGSGLPGGLIQGGLYYVRRVSSTTITLHPTKADADANTNIVDITSQGTGTHRITFTPVFSNKDEFWKSGRKGKLTRFWNTDYRNPEAADWIKLPPTLDGKNDITAVAKTIDRMFIFTINAMIRFDGQNLVPLRNGVGCVAHRSIAYYDTFLVWLDPKGRIWFRNEEGDDQDILSEPIQDTMALVPKSQLPDATAVVTDKKYKLYLGQIEDKTLRVVYDFRTNQWTEEWFQPMMVQQFEYTYNGESHPHFFDEVGQLWVDEEGQDDNGEIIPFEAEIGDDDFGVDELKAYHGIKVWSENVAACKVFVSIDRGEFIDCGQLTKHTQAIQFPPKLPKGTTINIRFVDSSSLKPVQINKAVVWYTREEDTFRATR